MISQLESQAERIFQRQGYQVHNFDTEHQPYPRWIAEKLILKAALNPNKKSFKNLVGEGKPDLLVYSEDSREFFLCEVKSNSDSLSYSQSTWFRDWSESVDAFILRKNEGSWETMGWEKGDELEFQVKDSETLEVSKKQ